MYNVNQDIDGNFNYSDGVNTVGTPSTLATVEVKDHQFGPFVRTDFTLNAMPLTITDGAGSGSHGTVVLYTCPACAVTFLGSRADYTAFTEDATLTTDAGDASIEIGIGTTAIAAAADGTLGDGASENISQAVALVMSSGTNTGTTVDGCKTTALNGTATATTMNLNVSGTAATIDATGVITVTGTFSVLWCHMGDD